MDQLGFVHVSDCHFGSVLMNETYSWMRQTAHDIHLCKELMNALEEARELIDEFPEDASLPMVMSGDLTASGKDAEFAVGHSFFRSQWRLRRTDTSRYEMEVGLGLPSDKYASVPGNHDHWSGSSFITSPAVNPNLVPSHFAQSPWCKGWDSHGGDLRLEIYGLDSNAGLTGLNRRARGRFDPAHLGELESMLQATSAPPGKVVVRAVVVHHSLAYTSNRLKAHTLELEPSSRDELLRICAANRCVAILTGHTHDFHHHPFAGNVHELRCATTLQGPPQREKQGFLFHRIDQKDDGTCRWCTWKYVLDDEQRYRRSAKVSWEFEIR